VTPRPSNRQESRRHGSVLAAGDS